MDIVVLAIVVLPALIAIGALVRARHRWGARRVMIRRGDGAYRGGEVGVPIRRAVPVPVTVAALASWMWGALTMFVFVPAGGMLAIVSLDQDAIGMRTATSLFVMVVVLSGIAHAFALFVAGTQVARHHPKAATTAKKTAVFAWWHHAWVLFGLTFCALLHQVELAVMALACLSIPCGIGAMVGERSTPPPLGSATSSARKRASATASSS